MGFIPQVGSQDAIISDLQQRVATLERLLQFSLLTSNDGAGAGSAELGSNCPATDPSTPYTWVEGTAVDQSTIWVPVWK
jgi:hypothetical protein